MGVKRWRIVSATVLNLLISGLAAFAILSGADPTLVAAAALVVLGGVNGMQLHEFLAVQQALAEMGESGDDRDQSDE